MIAKDVNIKNNDVPEGWSIEAADFINKVLLKKERSLFNYFIYHYNSIFYL